MTKDTKSKPASGGAAPIVPNDPQSISFVKGLVARGEAARLTRRAISRAARRMRSSARPRTDFRSSCVGASQLIELRPVQLASAVNGLVQQNPRIGVPAPSS